MTNGEKLTAVLQRQQAIFRTVVPFDPVQDKLLLLDFTEKNTELTADILNDTNLFSYYISHKLSGAGCRYGLGGYAENRTVYSRSKHFDAREPGGEPRRLHLGIDIWGTVNTPVMAPCEAIVHSFGFNNGFGDYGATILLTHQLEGVTFHSLYGHLSLNSLKNMQEGNRIERGEIFAEFGMQFENGHWPPHLHFQLIIDVEKYKGDYPGVCKLSEKEKYLTNCPDPDIVLQMLQYA
jgi:murein DD-endopeptidase MepM/ murein hydrolase activator NlpD